MDSFAETLERADGIGAVEGTLPDEHPGPGGVLAAVAARLVDGTPVRLFALRHPDREPLRAVFETVRTEWELAGQQSGVIDVLARGDEPAPWIAVERPNGERFRDVGPSLSGPERWRVLTGIAETLYRAGIPHLACHPGRIWIDRDDGLTPRIDWAIDRVHLHPVSSGGEGSPDGGSDDLPETLRPYVAPELRRDPSSGDKRSDVYTLGMLAQFGRSGEASPADGPNSHGPGATTPESPVKAWVSNRATNRDPDRRFDSPYAFKRAALFGPTATADPSADPNETGAASVSPVQKSGSDRGRDDARARGSEDEGDERGTSSGGPSDAPGTVEARLGDISRRQAIGTTAAAALAGTVALLGYRTRGDSSPEEQVATGGEPELSASFDLGVLTLRNTGAVPLDTTRLLLSGAGFVAVPEQRLSGYVDDEALAPGGAVRIPADPAYELNVYYEREAEPLELVASDGPEAGGREPRPGPLYVPEMGFTLERRDDSLQVEYTGGAAVPADHVRFVGSGFGGAPEERWDRRLGTDGDDTIRQGDFTRYQVLPETVLRVEWAPPYSADATTLATYGGENRPLEETRGGVSGPRYDRRNTSSAPSGSAVDRQPTAAWSTELDDEPRGALAVDSGRVFASTGRYLYALDAIDGEILWQRYVEAGRPFEPVVDGRSVYVGTSGFGQESRLLAFDVTDGTQRWAFTTDTQGLRSPTASGGVLFTAGTSSAASVYVVDPSDGSGNVIEEVGPQVGDAAFDGQRLYLRTVTGGITAVGPREIDWTYPADGDLSPTVVGDTVYGVDSRTDGTARLFAVDIREGAEQWTAEIDGDVRIPQAVGGGTVFTGDADGVVTAVDAESGERQWTTDTGDRVYYGVVTAGETVYVAGLRTVTALASQDGRTRWSLDVDPLIGTVAAVSGGCLYIGTGGAVSAFCGPPSSDAG